jgi:serine/threonine protein phosphatase PrpC
MERDIKQTLLRLDQEMYALWNGCPKVGGSTLTAIGILPLANKMVTMNVGDSRVLVHGNHKFSTWDHKPNHFTELQRIYNSMGYVEHSRVNGVLALSRAFGDWKLKQTPLVSYHSTKGAVSTMADVHVLPFSHKCYRWIVLASDGVWDVLGNSQVVDILESAAAQVKTFEGSVQVPRDYYAEWVVGQAYQLGSADNLSAVVVKLDPND